MSLQYNNKKYLCLIEFSNGNRSVHSVTPAYVPKDVEAELLELLEMKGHISHRNFTITFLPETDDILHFQEK